MGEKLADAQAKAADLEHTLKQVSASEAALRVENDKLLEKLTHLVYIKLRVTLTTDCIPRIQQLVIVVSCMVYFYRRGF